MLTIKAPIEMKCRTDITATGDGFGERIRGNYGVIGSGINSEELMHLVTKPPEIYLAEGDVTNLVSSAKIENNQVNKVNIINNFLNRVLVNGSANLTYQDRVYITNILHQLGIKDERKFMEQVQELKSEVNETNTQINRYWNELSQVSQMTQVINERQGDVNIHREEVAGGTENRLYQTILNRLKTGAVYQIVENFTSHVEGDTVLDEAEYKISEQTRLTKNILLNRLENTVLHQEAPMTFLHENYYEEHLSEDTEVTETTVNANVNSAILLNMIDNLYQSRFETLQNKENKYFRFETAFYEGGDNTIERISKQVENRFFRSENYISRDARLKAAQALARIEQEAPNLTMEYKEGDIIEEHEGDVTLVDAHTEEIRRIEQELNLINQQNIARSEAYQQNLTMIRKDVKQEVKPPDRQKAIEESLLALEHPTEYIREVRSEEEQKRQQEQQSRNIITEILPEQENITTRILKEYLDSPETFVHREDVIENNLTQLVSDIHRVEQENELRKETERRVTVEKEVVDEVLTERVRELRQAKPEIKVEKRRTDRSSLIFKTQESLVDEELIEELIKQNHRIELQNERIDTIITNNQTETQNVINNTEHHTTTEYRNDVSEVVEQSLRGQMDEITEKVYDKLSRRLNNERIRRGR